MGRPVCDGAPSPGRALRDAPARGHFFDFNSIPDFRAVGRPPGILPDRPGYGARVVLDHEGKTPLYLQIAGILRERITSGQIRPGRPLPSEPQLVGEFGVSRLTARKAVHVLADEGLVEVVQGRGSYVRD